MIFKSKVRDKRVGLRRRQIFTRTAPPPKRAVRISWRVWRSFLSLALVGFLLYFFFVGTYFKIKDVVVEGVKSVEIADHLKRTLIGKNILLLRPGNYLRELSDNFPVLEESRIVRGLPSTVKVVASERRQVLIWCADICAEVDNYGFAYQEVKRPEDRVVLSDESGLPVKVGDRVASTQFIAFYLEALEQIEELGLEIVETTIQETVLRVDFVVSEGWRAIVDSSESLKNQISALEQVLEEHREEIHEYADVRVPGVVYFK